MISRTLSPCVVRIVSVLLIVFVLLLPRLAHSDGAVASTGARPDEVTRAKVMDALGKLPLYFVENRGQVDPSIAYYVRGRDTSVAFGSGGVTFVLSGRDANHTAPDARRRLASLRPGARGTAAINAPQRYTLGLDFVGANPDVRPVGEDPTPAIVSYFKGHGGTQNVGLPTYTTLVYRDLWPGIDLVYAGSVNRLKYTFVVKPGADPSQIKLAYRGATAVAVNDAGELEVSTPVAGFRDDRPYAYQESAGKRVEVATAYALAARQETGPHAYGFRVAEYDRTQPLILDPAVVVYAGYVGGAGNDQGFGIAVDSAGNAYITGTTASDQNTFPDGDGFGLLPGPDQTFNAGGNDAFVVKVKADGTGLEYAGYIGGSGNDQALGIAVDSAGNAYITGVTDSLDFPVTAAGPNPFVNGSTDGFVAKVNAAGTGLVYAGYIGGTGYDEATAIAVDSAGNAYVTGNTSSDEVTFPNGTGFLSLPGLPGPDQTFNGGNPGLPTDAYVVKVKADGSGFAYAGYIGGAGDESGIGIAVDSAGNAYITGYTTSDETTFPNGDGFESLPGLPGPDQTFNGGSSDGFIVKVNVVGDGLVYAGYIGGASFDEGRAIAVDSAGNAYVTGSTSSDETTFPGGTGFGVLPGPDQTFNGGNDDAFVVKVKADGTGLVYAGYIGGDGDETGNGIAVDSTGNAYITGYTTSDEATFPNGNGFVSLSGPDQTYNDFGDAFVVKVKVSGTGLVYAGYIGGGDTDVGTAIAVDSSRNAYITGYTYSTEATFPNGGGFVSLPGLPGPDQTHNGDIHGFPADAFVVKIGAQAESFATVTVAATDPNAAEAGPDPGVFTVSRSGDTSEALTVNFAVSGTATQGTDYGTIGTSVTIPVGQSSTTVTITPVADTTVEGNETVDLTLASGTGYTVGSPNTATVTIANGSGKLQAPSSFNFGNTTVGGQSTVTKSISNANRTESLVVQVNAPSPNPPFSLMSGGGTVTIPPRGSHAVTLRFSPTVKGQATGTLVINSSDPANPTATIGLNGRGR